MPGNEAVDRVHNFFGQENLSQGQYHSQAVDGNWPGQSNSFWVGSQRPTGVSFLSNVKNFNQQQSDSEQGHINSPHLRHGLNLSQSNFRHESGRAQLPNQQADVSGYMQGNQVFHARQNGANVLGMDPESDWRSLSRGMPVLESQGSGLEYKKNFAGNDASESPVNFDFLGGQQQVSGRHNFESPRQHSGINEMHLLQQQAALNQMQELQRQQQFHQVEAKQQNSMTPISQQMVTNHSASLVNGIPVNEASNFAWHPDVMPNNANWFQRGASPVMHGSSNGLMLSPEQGQALRQMGLVPNQGDQSLYGVPISGSRGNSNLYYHSQADKPAVHQVSFPQQYAHPHVDKSALPHISAGSSSFPAHQYASFSDQINTDDGTSVSRQDIQENSMFGSTSHGINSRLNVENLQQVNSEQTIVPMQDFHGREELAGSLEMSSQDNMLVQAPPSQNVATLDPTEEKILFGSDDSLWDGFGSNTFNMLDGTDSSSGIPSLQSGSWSALMQSAVAETSSSNVGIQDLSGVWRDAESAGSHRRSEGSEKYKHHMENPLILESSKNGKIEGDADDAENSNKKDKSADGLGSYPSHPRESSSFNGNDLCSQKLSVQVNQRPPIARKFQYHPMGDLGVEGEPYGNKYVTNSQHMNNQHLEGLKGQDQSYLGQSKYGHCDANSSEIEKGDSKSLDNNVPKNALFDHMPKTMTSLDKNVGNSALQKTSSRRVPETESSDGSTVHPLWNQNSSSQGFGLQLAPPSQRSHVIFSRGSSETTTHVSETVDKGHSWLVTSQTFPSQGSSPGEIRNNISSTTGQIFDKASQYNMPGNIQQAFTSGFPFSRNHTQNQNMAHLGGHTVNTQSASLNLIDEYCEGAQTSQSEIASAQDMSQLSSTDQIHMRDPAIHVLAAQAGRQPSATYSASLHGAPSKVLHNLWTSVSTRQHSNASKIPSQSQQINDCEMTTGSRKPDDEGPDKDSDDLSSIGACSAYSNSPVGNVLKESSRQQALSECVVGTEEAGIPSHLKEPSMKSVSGASQPNLDAISRDIEALGQSSKPNNVLNHSLSLLDQVHSTRNVEIDPSNREAKRLKVSDNMVDKQQPDSNHGQQLSYGFDNVVKDVSRNSSSIPSSDSSMSCFSTKPHDGNDINATSKDVVGYGQKNALNSFDGNKAISVRSDHSIINPEMAPTWFEQFGTSRNGKISLMYDAWKTTAGKFMNQPVVIPNQSDSLPYQNSMGHGYSLNDAQVGSTVQSPIPASVASDNVRSQLLTPTVEPDLLIMKPKKRKSDTSELPPWHKELTHVSERLRDLSVAELEWTRAVNRLIEKVDGDTGVVENLPAMVKSKRRLVLTTQLMQQLLSPPPAAVLVADVKLHHESVVYTLARLTLREACSSISWSRRTSSPPGIKNLLPEKSKSPDNIDHYILRVMDIVDRTKKLEDDLLRLDSRASILDLRVDCQELEKASVINRFARFHTRAQNDGAETSSSSDASANPQNLFPLKYITAVPLPRYLPDRVQCLSL